MNTTTLTHIGFTDEPVATRLACLLKNDNQQADAGQTVFVWQGSAARRTNIKLVLTDCSKSGRLR